MRFVADPALRARKLQLAADAAASAVLNGVDPAEVLERVQQAMAEAQAANDRHPGQRTTVPPAAAVPPASGALADWVRQVAA